MRKGKTTSQFFLEASVGWSGPFLLMTLIAVAAVRSQAQVQATADQPGGFGMLASSRSRDAGLLSTLTFSKPSVIGGETTILSLTMDHPAPANGVTILLSSSDPSGLTVPASVVLAEGESSIRLTVSTVAVTAAVSVAVRAQLAGSFSGANLLVLPVPTAPFSVTVLPATVTVDQGKSGTVTVTTKVNSGFDHSLQLTASGEPANVTLTFDPDVIPAPGSGTSKLSIDVASDVQTGGYPLTITATEGSDSASAKTTLKVSSGSGNPDATFKGCWYTRGSHRYQGVDFSCGNPGTYSFNALLYYGTTCNANDMADQIGFGELIDFGGLGWIFWFNAFANRTDMSAIWYVGDENSKCVNYETAPDC